MYWDDLLQITEEILGTVADERADETKRELRGQQLNDTERC